MEKKKKADVYYKDHVHRAQMYTKRPCNVAGAGTVPRRYDRVYIRTVKMCYHREQRVLALSAF